MELTKKDKIAIYKKALEGFKYDNSLLFGLCWHISLACEKLQHVIETAYYEGMELNYPEINKFKPKDFDESEEAYWFPCDKKGMAKRMGILEKVIKKLEAEL